MWVFLHTSQQLAFLVPGSPPVAGTSAPMAGAPPAIAGVHMVVGQKATLVAALYATGAVAVRFQRTSAGGLGVLGLWHSACADCEPAGFA